MVRKRERKRRLKKAVSVGMLSIMLGAFGMEYASANNHYDSPFAFILDYSEGDPFDYTRLRAKIDDSSSYIDYEDGNFPFAASISAGYDAEHRVPDDWIVRRTKNVMPGNIYYLVNYVKESGYGFAALRGESAYDVWYRVFGLWSPDSI